MAAQKQLKADVLKPKARTRAPRKPVLSVEEQLKASHSKLEHAMRDTTTRLKDVERNTNARFKTTNSLVRKIELNVEPKIKSQLEKQIKRLEKLNNLVKLDNRMKTMEDRLVYVDERMRHMINRETILTEVSRFVRNKDDWALMAQFHVAIMKAFNQPDEWWGSQNHELEIGEWYTKIMKLLEE